MCCDIMEFTIYDDLADEFTSEERQLRYNILYSFYKSDIDLFKRAVSDYLELNDYLLIFDRTVLYMDIGVEFELFCDVNNQEPNVRVLTALDLSRGFESMFLNINRMSFTYKEMENMLLLNYYNSKKQYLKDYSNLTEIEEEYIEYMF